MMPGRSGLEAITEIRKCSPSSKILMLSAMTEEQVHDPRARSAPDAWLAKGATAATLTDAIARLLRGEPNEMIEADADLDVDEWAAQALIEARAAFDDTFDACDGMNDSCAHTQWRSVQQGVDGAPGQPPTYPDDYARYT